MIKNSISVSYQPDQGSSFLANVAYEIDMNENIQTLTCNIAAIDSAIPTWCQPKKFIVRSLFEDKEYTLLYNENKEIRHIDMAIFIEKVYADIMQKEKRKQAAFV
jgi:hypothetical protein